jgi:hypothetical protein
MFSQFPSHILNKIVAKFQSNFDEWISGGITLKERSHESCFRRDCQQPAARDKRVPGEWDKKNLASFLSVSSIKN